MKKKKLRPLGDIMLDLELVLEQLTDSKQHDMQWGEVLHLVYGWLSVHAPHAREEYTEGGHPSFFYYGYKEQIDPNTIANPKGK